MDRHLTAAEAPESTLIVGGAGFIGSHIAEALLARGGEVRVLDDLSVGRTSSLLLHDPNLELRAGDMLDYAAVHDAMAGMHACVHVAARPLRGSSNPYEAALSNILGFINVLEAARAHRIGRLVYASSAAVYGTAGDRPLSEDTTPAPVTPDGLEKLVAEGYAAMYGRQYRLPALGLRYFNVYGPCQEGDAPGAGVIPVLLERLAQRRPAVLHGDGRQVRDFVHVEDAAAATVAALNAEVCGVCNVATGVPTDLRQLVQLLGAALDLRPLSHFTPARPLPVTYSCGSTRLQRELLGFTPQHPLQAALEALASDWTARQRLRARAAPRAAAPPHPPVPRLRRVGAAGSSRALH
jgi:UDP-glucose 4-epimerase